MLNIYSTSEPLLNVHHPLYFKPQITIKPVGRWCYYPIWWWKIWNLERLIKFPLSHMCKMKTEPKFNSVGLFWESMGSGEVEKERERKRKQIEAEMTSLCSPELVVFSPYSLWAAVPIGLNVHWSLSLGSHEHPLCL